MGDGCGGDVARLMGDVMGDGWSSDVCRGAPLALMYFLRRK
jgi:hypothetical protein